MIKIAHRGNTRGPKPELENSPEYISKAIEDGFEVEIDIWFQDGEGFFLGHDYPKYKIDEDFTVHKIEYKFIDREHDLKELHTLTFTDPIAKNYANKEIEIKNNILMKSRKEVEINGNGTSGYTIKEGIHKGTVLGHISREKSVLEN